MYVYYFKTLPVRQAPLDTWDYLGILQPVYAQQDTCCYSDTGEITRISKKGVLWLRPIADWGKYLQLIYLLASFESISWRVQNLF